MLEHSDRHNAVEMSADVAIIGELESRGASLAALHRSLLCALELFLGQRDAGHARPGDLGKVERQAAPAAADVEHRAARRNAKLCGEMALLGELRVVERLVVGFEIGAAILLVAIEKEPIKPGVEVVMVRDIVTRAASWIELLETPEQVAENSVRQRPLRRGDPVLAQQDFKHFGD